MNRASLCGKGGNPNSAYLVVVRGAGNQLAFEDSQLIYELPLLGSDNGASRIPDRECEVLSSPLTHQAPSFMQDLGTAWIVWPPAHVCGTSGFMLARNSPSF
jgi:hypothetical protein